MKTYDIWSEGYVVTGNDSPAYYHVACKGDSFKEACIEFFKDDKFFDKKSMSYWGCELFDNEEDARKFNG